MPDIAQTPDSYVPDWSKAPAGWNWAAQDEDGRWFWYRTEPVLGVGGGIWRSNSRSQRLAGQGRPNPLWYESLRSRSDRAPLAKADPTAPDPA